MNASVRGDEQLGDEQLGDKITRCFAEIDDIGHDPSDPDSGYNRFAWTDEDAALRSWFRVRCEALGLVMEQDSAGNLWGWWLPKDVASPSRIPPRSAVTSGSHLDSVPHGGAYDGPLGVISALLAIAELRRRDFRPTRSIGVVCFSDEEGARFGKACLGSRTLTAAHSADQVLGLRDSAGVTVAEALGAQGVVPEGYGPDRELLDRLAAHVELHVEQGYALAPAQAPLGVATGIWPHGRWHVTFAGEANHAGTTPLAMRRDASIGLAHFVLDARRAAEEHRAVATVGRILLTPNGVNVIPSHADAWLDVRAAHDDGVDAVLTQLGSYEPQPESRTPATVFDSGTADRLVAACRKVGVAPVRLPTAAGHDAGILENAGVPTGMLFVRSVNGASHTPHEQVEIGDCILGVLALSGYLEDCAR